MSWSESHRLDAWTGLEVILDDEDRSCWPTGAHRSRTLPRALSTVWNVRQRIGVTRVARLTDYDFLGIPVAGTVRPMVRDAQITVTQGKGLTEAEAIVSALFEAVERDAAGQRFGTLRASPNEIASSARAHLGFEQLGIDLGSDQVIEWVDGHSLRSGTRCLVPLAAVAFPYYAPRGTKRPLRPSTTGLAAGSTVAEALTQAAFEVLERDAVSRFLEGADASLVDVRQLEGSIEGELLGRFKAHGVEVFVADVSGAGPVPAYFACGYSPDGPGPTCVMSGQGAHLQPRIALRRALLELAQSRVVALQGSREDLVRHASEWQDSPEMARRMWSDHRSHCGSGTTRDLAFQGAGATSNADLLVELLERLQSCGYDDLVFVDVTRPEVEIPVVRVIIPGCVDTVVDPDRRRSNG